MSVFNTSKVVAIDTTKNLGNVIKTIMEMNFHKDFKIFNNLEQAEVAIPYLKNTNIRRYKPLIIVFIYADGSEDLVLKNDDGNREILYIYLSQHISSESLNLELCKKNNDILKNSIYLRNYVSKIQLLNMLENVGNFIDTYITLHDDYPFSSNMDDEIDDMIDDIRKSLNIKSMYNAITEENNKEYNNEIVVAFSKFIPGENTY